MLLKAPTVGGEVAELSEPERGRRRRRERRRHHLSRARGQDCVIKVDSGGETVTTQDVRVMVTWMLVALARVLPFKH